MRSEYEIWQDELKGKPGPFPWGRFLLAGALCVLVTAALLNLA